MKRIIIAIVACMLLVISLYAQSEVTTFLGIPIDGNKKEFIKALKKKGFKKVKNQEDGLQGIFDGSLVNIVVYETNGKVSRVGVFPLHTTSVRNVKTEFNYLCRKFINKDNYVAQGRNIAIPTYEDLAIPEDEDIRYEMHRKNKNYEALFMQLPAPLDSIIKRYKPHENVSITMSDGKDGTMDLNSYLDLLEEYSKNSVWFKIEEQYGKFFIMLIYDNDRNRANGEDL